MHQAYLPRPERTPPDFPKLIFGDGKLPTTPARLEKLPPVLRVTNPLEHAQALWPGFVEGNPHGGKSIWPVESTRNPASKLGDYLLYVRRTADPKVRQEDFAATVEYLTDLDGKADKYISLHTFYGWRRHANLKALTCFAVDLDLKLARDSRRLTNDFMGLRQDALDAIHEAGIPMPNLAVHSGRGVHLYWLFDQLVPAAAFRRWRAATKHLIALLVPHGCDPQAKDTARVLRLVGTKNTKALWHDGCGNTTPWTVSCEVLHSQRHAFDFLTDQILPHTRKDVHDHWAAARDKKPNKNGHRTKSETPDAMAELGVRQARRMAQDSSVTQAATRRPGRSYRDTCIARLADLETLASAQFGGAIPPGQRDLYLFHASCNLAWICRPGTLESEIVLWKRRFVPDWSDAQALAAMGTVIVRAKEAYGNQANGVRLNLMHDPRYTYSSETIWNTFSLAVDAAGLDRKLRTILPPGALKEIKKSEARVRRAAAGAASYTGKGIRSTNLPRAAKARELSKGGASLRDIASELGTAPKTIAAWLKLPGELFEASAEAPPPPPSSYPQALGQKGVLPKFSINNGVAQHGFEGRLSTAPSQGGSGGESALKGEKVPSLAPELGKREVDGAARETVAAVGPDSAPLGQAKQGEGDAKKRRKQIVLLSPRQYDLKKASKPKHTEALLARVRQIPVSVALPRLGLHVRPDESYRPRGNPDSRRAHVSLESGQVVELVYTDRRWVIPQFNFGGGNPIGLVMYLCDLTFPDAVALLAGALDPPA